MRPNDVLRRARTAIAGSDAASALLVYLASRVYTTAVLAGVFALATANGWTFASHRDPQSFANFLWSWDGSAYRSIARHGYPVPLPHDAEGRVSSNPWAFLPLYPALVAALMRVTGLGFAVLAPAVSVVAGAIAVVLLARLARRGDGSPRWAVVLLCAAPLTFVLQVAYAESLFLALALGALVALHDRRYALVGVLGVAAAATRPGALALALAVAIVVVVRVRARDIRAGEVARAAISATAIGLAGLAWPVIAAVVTGDRNAYLATETAFWRPLLGDDAGFLPLTPWFVLAYRYLGVGGIALVAVVLLAAGAVLVALARGRIALASRAFVVSYALYLVAVFLPQQSTVRLLLPMAPALADRRLRPGTARGRVAVVVALCALQIPAVAALWFGSFP
ncbi:hypothetical protein QT381_10610 [Galbitalea sp. SE-J8]|uniref:hypothetical protein n=1 Tax=Galbitalea sp. SE-J8 TaxID=3054952 RepID=UPI00259D1804|nr:hypothetical protein [Galbitalea sp. SE-J8]MDM4763460.1 hypothetical protein [Galbitalea sp. SE-J8]